MIKKSIPKIFKIFFFIFPIIFSKTTVTLQNAAAPGTEMPIVGLGTGGYGTPGNIDGEYWDDDVAELAVKNWILAGGRRIDTSNDYNTQNGVGRAINSVNIPRGNLFITSKVGPRQPMGFNDVLRQVEEDLSQLKTSYIDLVLIHWPGTGNGGEDPAKWPCCCYVNQTSFKLCRQESWRALETVFLAGKAKAIGVSNFEVNHIQDIVELKGLIPAVNQVEFHPYFHENDLLNYCKENNITFNGYSSVGCPDHMKYHWKTQIISQSVVENIAVKYVKTPGQIILKWSMQQGLVVNARTRDVQHMKDDLDVFDFQLTAEEFAAISAIEKPTNPKICGDSTIIP